MNRWREHIERSRELLDQAEAAANTPRALSCLYETIVEITKGICELEKPKEDQVISP